MSCPHEHIETDPKTGYQWCVNCGLPFDTDPEPEGDFSGATSDDGDGR